MYRNCSGSPSRTSWKKTPVDALLTYMMSLVLSDKEISEDEISLVYNFGSNIGFSEKEISVKFAEMIQRNYMPSLESIC